MPTFDVTAEGLAALMRAHDEQRRQAIRAAVVESAFAGAEVVAQAAPKDQGTLRQSVHVEQYPAGDGAEIVVDAPHAGIIENGSRPHTPPLAPLVDWVRRHADAFGIDPGWEHQVQDIARAIQRKIAEHGTRPHFFVKGSLPTLRKILGALIDKAVQRGPE